MGLFFSNNITSDLRNDTQSKKNSNVVCLVGLSSDMSINFSTKFNIFLNSFDFISSIFWLNKK